MLVGAAVVGAAIWLSVAADVGELVTVTGWWALVALVFPALVALGAWRESR